MKAVWRKLVKSPFHLCPRVFKTDDLCDGWTAPESHDDQRADDLRHFHITRRGRRHSSNPCILIKMFTAKEAFSFVFKLVEVSNSGCVWKLVRGLRDWINHATMYEHKVSHFQLVWLRFEICQFGGIFKKNEKIKKGTCFMFFGLNDACDLQQNNIFGRKIQLI